MYTAGHFSGERIHSFYHKDLEQLHLPCQKKKILLEEASQLASPLADVSRVLRDLCTLSGFGPRAILSLGKGGPGPPWPDKDSLEASLPSRGGDLGKEHMEASAHP